jgi:hypothetical protein
MYTAKPHKTAAWTRPEGVQAGPKVGEKFKGKKKNKLDPQLRRTVCVEKNSPTTQICTFSAAFGYYKIVLMLPEKET